MRLFEAGDVLRGPFPLLNSNKKRPYIIVVDEDPTDGTLIVCTTTDDSIWSDKTTPLAAGCHPLVDKDCTVVYGHALVLSAQQVQNIRDAVQRGDVAFDPDEKLGHSDLARVQEGFGDINGIAVTDRDVAVGAYEYAKKRGIV